MNPLLILINSGEFISPDHCINFIIRNKLDIHINDFIKYIHINFFDFIDIKSIYSILILNHSNYKDFTIDETMLKSFNITNIRRIIKKCKLIKNVDYVIMPKSTSWVYYLSHFCNNKKEYILTPFAFKSALVYNNPEYIKYVLLLDLCINYHLMYLSSQI